MNKSDLKEIKDIVDSALGTHLASVHEEITDSRDDLKQEVNELRRDLLRVETTLTAKIDQEMRNLTPADLVEDMSVIRSKRVAEDEQCRSVLCVSLAYAGKNLEVVMQVGAVLNLGQLALAIALSNEDRKQVIL